jgi:hypothetical protein
MIENIEQIETGLGLTAGTLKDAIASEENVKIDVPQGKIYDDTTHVIRSNEDHKIYINNIKEENEVRGVEKAVKMARTEHSLDFEGSRKGDGENVNFMLKAFAAKAIADANIDPDKKIEALTNDVEVLKGLNGKLQVNYDEMVEQTARKDNQRKVDTNIYSAIPENLTLPKDDIMLLFKAKHDVVEEDGKIVVKENGSVMKNDLRDTISVNDVMTKFSEQYVKAVEGGTGQGDTNGQSKGGSLEAFAARMEKQGVPQGSEEFSIAMNKEMEAGTLVVA